MHEAIKTVTSIISYTTGDSIPYPIPVGLVAVTALLFYRKFFKNPFKLSIDDLKRHIAEARVEEEKLSKEIKGIERLIKRVEAKEIEGDKDLLYTKKKQLEEAINLAITKIRVSSMLIMIRENMNTLNRLFGKDNFKLLLDVEEISKHVDKELERLEGVDINELDKYFNNIFPLILKKPEEFVVKEEKQSVQIAEQQYTQTPSPSRPVYIQLEQVDNMLKGGSVEEWIDLLKGAVENNRKIKIPPRYEGKEGYKNLLIALYLMDGISQERLKEVIEDRFLSRAIEYLEQLKKGSIEVIPDSSDREYLDNIINIICGDPVKESTEGGEKIKYYKLSLKDYKMIIKRRTVIDPTTKRAQTIIYTTLNVAEYE